MQPHALGPRARLLLRSRAVRIVALLWIAASVAMCFFPLTARPGYVQALGVNLLTGLLGLFVGVAAARLEQRIADVRPHPGIPLHLRRPGGAVHAVALTSAAAFLVLLGLGLLSLCIAIVSGLVVGTCDLWADLAWYPVLPLVSMVLASVTGVLVGALARRRLGVLFWCVVILLGSAAVSAWPVLFGPQVFVVNHFLGYLPGPLYDEHVAIGRAVLGYQGLSLAWSALLVGLGAVLLDPADLRLRPVPGPRRGASFLLVLVAGVAVVTLEAERSKLGFYQSDATIARALGGEARTAHFVIHYPKERKAKWVRRMVTEHELRYAELERWLALKPGGAKVESWIFRSAREKQRLIGAGATDVAKPWRRALYVYDDGFPPRVLKHELTHVLAGSFGRGPFAVASSNGILPNQGLEEGLAVAAAWPANQLTVHDWARAMRALKVAPDIRGLFSTWGFLVQAPSRAYTLAGSFMRWLVDTKGIAAVKRAYRAGDLSVIGKPSDLFAAWKRFLDSKPVSPLARRLAEARFRRPSIVLRPCAFDVTRALAKARAALAAGRRKAGIRWIERCIALEPDAPWHLQYLMDVELSGGDLAAAKKTAEKLLHHPKRDPAIVSRAEMALGDIAWKQGDTTAADAAYAKVIAIGVDPGLVRLATAKRLAMADPALTPVLRPLLMGKTPGDMAMLELHELWTRRPGQPLVSYLLGRQLVNRHHLHRALPWLVEARDAGLTPDGGLAEENLRLIARTKFDLGDYAGAEKAWAAFAAGPGATSGGRVRAADWIARSRFFATPCAACRWPSSPRKAP